MGRQAEAALLFAGVVMASGSGHAEHAAAQDDASEPTSAPTDDEGPGRMHSSLYGLVGLQGELTQRSVWLRGNELGPSYGVGLRVGGSPHPNLVLGLSAAWTAFEEKGVHERDHGLDVDAFVLGRHRVRDVGGGTLELYLVLPGGMSAIFPAVRHTLHRGVGWNVGLLGGVSYTVAEPVAAFVELGFRHHVVELEVDGVVDDYQYDPIQLRVHVGASANF